jgi:phosphoribosyl 1,2-cyclic phosphate phosphodiesterase
MPVGSSSRDETREEGTGIREEGRGKREEFAKGRENREQYKNSLRPNRYVESGLPPFLLLLFSLPSSLFPCIGISSLRLCVSARSNLRVLWLRYIMKLRFLGTSAGELYPGIWCHCQNCEAARHGAPEDLRQSAALYIEPDDAAGSPMLIDFPPEIASQSLRHHVPLAAVQHLLVTHSHGDHWHPYQLRWRGRPAELVQQNEQAPTCIGGPRFTELARLHIWGNAVVEAVLQRELGVDLVYYDIEYHRIMAGEGFQAGNFRVDVVAANHDVGREEAMHFIIRDAEKTILYGLDGDTFLPETRKMLHKYRFDTVILESTYGYGDGGNHRNYSRVISEAEWFRHEGLLTKAGEIIAMHFSPHHCPPHSECCSYLARHNITAAWDGMESEV